MILMDLMLIYNLNIYIIKTQFISDFDFYNFQNEKQLDFNQSLKKKIKK